MKEVTLKIPDKKFNFFMELFKQLGIEVAEKTDIPEEHKEIVIERMKKSEQNPDRLLDWDQVQDNFRFD
jgi:molybdopterin-biosynthesis enzyme MoeA-like protein